MNLRLLVAALAAIEAMAYDDSLADCKAFAALFKTSCGSVDTPIPSVPAEAGITLTC